MFSNKNRNVLLILCIAAFLFIYWFYGDIIKNPNSYLFSDKGDGIKNYFTYAWHISNDTSYVNFQGMNYPYGEHFLYTDCHPLFTVILKLSATIFPYSNNISIGFLNLFMLVSFILTCVFLYLILLKFNVNRILAALGAFSISVLSPQIFRMSGHLALSYSFFIPLTWYLLICYSNDNRKKKWIILLFLNNIFWFFIHAYLGMMVVFFNFCYLLIPFLRNFKKNIKETHIYLSFLIQVLLPIIIFRFFLKLTDIHFDRTPNPFGFFIYNAELDDIFIPNHPPLRPFLDNFFTIKLQWEAWGYVGITSIIILLYLIINFCISIVRKEKANFLQYYFPDRFLNIALLSSIILLIFAFGIPFKQYPPLLDYIPVIKNFRGTGRFVWFFYFVFTTFVFYTLNNFYQKLASKTNKNFALLLIAVGPALLFTEGISYHSEMSQSVNKSQNIFERSQLPETYKNALNTIHAKKYQAILSLPFFYIGSESYDRPPQNSIEKISFIISYHSKIPLFASHLTRTGIFESKNIIQLISPDFYTKSIKNDLKSNDPFLIIKSNEPLTFNENRILEKCTKVYESSDFSMFEIHPDAFFSSSAQKEVDLFNSIRSKLYYYSGFYTNDTSGIIYYNNFDKNLADTTFCGSGVFSGFKSEKNIFATFPTNTFKSGNEYIISAWMFNGQQDALNDWYRFIIEEKNSENTIINSTEYFPNQSEVINGNWSLIEVPFRIKDPKNTITILSVGNKGIRNKIYLDDLLIRENKCTVYKVIKEKNGLIIELFKNNQSICVQ